MGDASRTLSVVIPALDEQDAIADTIRRCLDAREEIVAKTGLDAVEVIVVSDGSTDDTEVIAHTFPEVAVLAFEHNRGYGAAIQCGFAHARGDWLGFLDADGTCDPRVFAPLCLALEEQGAGVALGSRMGPGSAMPAVRRLGNWIFAVLLGILSKRRVADTASGMRVLRRSALAHLQPLPDGLHFTPAMTARVLLEDEIGLAEVPMPYAERVGRSKLSVLRDGVRFLASIARAAATYRPARLLLPPAAALALGAAGVGAGPVLFYLGRFELEEWMIYRILLASLLATLAGLFAAGAVVSERVAAIAHGRPPARAGVTGLASRLFTRRMRRVGAIALPALAVVLVWPGLVQYAATREVDMHWSRAVLASLLLVAGAILAVATFLLNMMDLIEMRRVVGHRPPEPDRVRPAAEAGA